MSRFTNLRWLSLPCFAAVPCFAFTNIPQNSNSETSSKDDELLLVHVFHRHGDRTPWFALRDYERSKQTWVPLVSSQYHSFDSTTLEPAEEIYSWQYLSSKLRGTSLAFKHNNWNRHSSTVFDSASAEHASTLCELYTLDRNKYPFLGQLTNKGCEQLEQVGQQLRQRYVDDMQFLPSEYNPSTSNLHYHSTNLARTIQSADCVVEQLYPSHTRKNEARIPLHIDTHLTYLSPTRLKIMFCDKLKVKSDLNLNEMLTRMDERFHELTDKVEQHFPKPNTRIHMSGLAFDGMNCRMAHDIDDRPKTFSEEELREFGKYQVKLVTGMFGAGLDTETLRLTWGNVLSKMMESMKAVGKGEDKNGHMLISSCHDDSLLAMMSCLYGDEIHETDMEWPPYGTVLIFELWKDGNSGNKMVKLLYNGEPLNAFDGSDTIELDRLEEMWKDLMIDEGAYFNGACAC